MRKEQVLAEEWLTLTSGEEVDTAKHPSVWTAVPKILLGVLAAIVGLVVIVMFHSEYDYVLYIGLIAIVAGLASAVIAEFKRRHIWYVLTNERIIKKRGLVARDTREARYDRVQDVTTRIDIKERFLNYGDIRVTTSGTNVAEFRLENVPDATSVTNSISEYKDQAVERQYRQQAPENGDDA